MKINKILDNIFKVKVLLNEIADGVLRPAIILHVPKGTKCKGCPALFSIQTDEDTCGLAAMWGELGRGAVGLEDGKKSQACLEDTKHYGAAVTSNWDKRGDDGTD